MHRTLVAWLILAVVVAWAGSAEARHIRYSGPHPIAARFGGGYCYIEAPHLHAYPPDHPALYQQVGEEYVFTGDPSPFGYDGDKHTFYGHHPIVGAVGGEPVYCYIDGPHSHPYPPPDGAEWKTKGGVAFYVGPFAPSYVKMKGHRARLVNAEYRPYAAMRPTVEVAPPPEWHGDVYVAGPEIEVGAPGVVVAPPVVVGPAPVLVAPPGPHVVVVGPPVPHVVVGAPAPHVVVVGPPAPHVVIGAPAPFVVAPGPGVVVVKGHHDNGLHKGWFKHGHGE